MAASSKRKSSSILPASLSLESDQQREFEQRVKDIREKVRTGSKRGVLYVGHIPHGFFENQMRNFFKQFGKVTRLRLSRSKRTGGSKGYGFVEFEYAEVAKVAADTMNNYLMFEKLLKCEFMPPEKVHESIFKGADRKFQKPRAHILAIDRHNKPKTEIKQKKGERKLKKKINKKFNKLAAMGISYSVDIHMAEGKTTTMTVKNAVEKDTDVDVKENTTNKPVENKTVKALKGPVEKKGVKTLKESVEKKGVKALTKSPAVKKSVKNVGVKAATKTPEVPARRRMSERLKKAAVGVKDSPVCVEKTVNASASKKVAKR
ncbi:MKI67 FHA domain-interacting nucleolar phosphoprotein-like [Lineus longissimus]|uniref:MKI67 FHA domain-interacting nucleolar phosphoprotein-like n=1 Tax=Lineus longissimus TaxID=88925 RepID=UPI002B4EA6E1